MRALLLAFVVVASLGMYPATQREPTVETYFGVRVADPYRWLEALHAVRTRAWVSEEDALTQRAFAREPQRAALRALVLRLLTAPREGLPQRGGDASVRERSDGSSRPAVLVARSRGRTWVLFDPRVWRDTSVTLAGWHLSPDGRYLAYAAKRAGAGLVRWHVRVLRSGRDDPAVIVGTPDWAPIAWSADGRGFYYGGYPSEAARPPGMPIGTAYAVRFHRVGTLQSSDRLIYARPDRPTWLPYAQESDDGRYLIVGAVDGAGGNLVAIRDLRDPTARLRLVRGLSSAAYAYVTNDGNRAYFFTNVGAPRGKLVAVDLRDPSRVRDVIPQRDAILENVTAAGNVLLARYLCDVRSELVVFDHGGRLRHVLALPGIGTVSEVDADVAHAVAYYAFSSLTVPPMIVAYDTRRQISNVIDRERSPFDAARYVTEELFARSDDGTRVPVFVAHRRGLRLDGRAPTMLTGYGGFGDTYHPAWWTPNEAWLAAGGTLAIAGVRGGGEYGEAWHRAGMLGNKQHAFDDLTAAARLLIERGYSSPRTLGLYGYSGGGLLVGVTEVQHPALFGAVVEAAGPVDVLRGETYGSEAVWTTEVGSPTKSAQQFRWLARYAPLLAIQRGTDYPATLVMTSENDERVSPAHAYKFAATLQWAQAGNRPILLDVARGTGHVGGGTLQAQAEPVADAEAFLFAELVGQRQSLRP